MHWQIRKFEQRDLAFLYELDQLCFPPEIAYSRAELLYFLAQPRCSCWVAASSPTTIAGFIIVERVRNPEQTAGHIVTLDVDPAARRQRLGALLMQTAEAQLKQEGGAYLRLEVACNNTAAQLFYSSLGFVTGGRIPKYYGGKIDAEIMEKAI